jgi:hypothetical protein
VVLSVLVISGAGQGLSVSASRALADTNNLNATLDITIQLLVPSFEQFFIKQLRSISR